MHFCCVPCCSRNSIREPHLSFYRLPLTNKRLLNQWIHRICRKNLLINGNTRVCSKHFHQASGCRLRCDEVPSVDLPTLSTSITPCKVRKPPTSCEFVDSTRAHLPSETVGTARTVSMAGDRTDAAEVNDASTQTEESLEQITEELAELKLKVATLTKELEKKEQQLRSQTIRYHNRAVRLPAILTVPAVPTVSDGK